MFLGLGAAEVMVILVIALVVLGPDKLPAVAKQLARMLKEVRRVSDDVRQQFDADDDVPMRRPSVALPAVSGEAEAGTQNRPPPAAEPAAGEGASSVASGAPGTEPSSSGRAGL